MRTYSLSIIVLFAMFICSCNNKGQNKEAIEHLPSKEYHYTTIDSGLLMIRKSYYVPVYSHIYINTGAYSYNLTSTLSIRNTSFRDSFYINQVAYYGSQGELLRNYLDSTLLLKPMASYEFVVEHTESKGGAGANFVVNWGAVRAKSEPLLQAVNCGSSNTGISFITEGVEIKDQAAAQAK